MSFGWRYDYAGRQIRPSADLPEFLLPLRERAARVAGLAAESLQQVLVTEYAPGAPIGWHRDKPDVPGRGGDLVPGALPSALPPAAGRRLGARRSLEVMPRSAYVLRGAAAERLGAQHPAAQRAALFGDVPQPARLMTSSTMDLAARTGIAFAALLGKSLQAIDGALMLPRWRRPGRRRMNSDPETTTLVLFMGC